MVVPLAIARIIFSVHIKVTGVLYFELSGGTPMAWVPAST